MENALALAYSLLGIKVETLFQGKRPSGKSRGSGVVITEINPRSYLARIGAAPGDVIRQMGELTVSNLDDFKKAIVKYRQKKYMTLLLQRGGRGYYITIEL